MSNRYRLLYAAARGCLIGFLICLPAIAIGQGNDKPDTGPKQDQSANQRPQPVVVLPYFTDLTKIYQPNTEERRTERQEQRDVDDLIAQQRMARASDDMVDVGWGEVAIAGIALAVSSFAAYFAWRAVNITRRGERAWMTMEDFEGHRFRDKDGKVTKVMLWFKWKNSGRTPALNAQGWSQTNEFWGKDPSKFKFERSNEKESTRFTAIGPDTTILTGPIELLIADVGMILRKGMRDTHIWSRIEYTDVFFPKKIRYSEARFAIRSDGPAERLLKELMDADIEYVKNVFRFEPYGDQNDAS